MPDLTQTGKSKRLYTIHHSINGSFAIPQGKWKLNLCPGSGGWSKPRPLKLPEGLPEIQLYNLVDDSSEHNNLQASHPELIDKLVNQLVIEIKNGRSTPGLAQNNDGPIPFPKKLLKAHPQLDQN